DFHGDLSVIAVESFVASLTCEAGHACDTGSPTDCLDVPIENLVGAGRRGNPAIDFDIVGIIGRRLAVLFQQTRDHFWGRAAAMARIAGYGFAASEQILINGVDDLNHPAGGALH